MQVPLGKTVKFITRQMSTTRELFQSDATASLSLRKQQARLPFRLPQSGEDRGVCL